MESDISKIEKELEQARRDLAQTFRQVNEKVEAVGAQLRPESQIRRHAGGAAGIAAAVGFAFAYSPARLKILGSLAAGAIVGLSVPLENYEPEKRGIQNGTLGPSQPSIRYQLLR